MHPLCWLESLVFRLLELHPRLGIREGIMSKRKVSGENLPHNYTEAAKEAKTEMAV